MIAAIEIGGTKLQFAVASKAAPASLADQLRLRIDRAKGADEIIRQIGTALERLRTRHAIEAIGVGFGGPVDCAAGCVITSHQVDGWDRFPLVDWIRQRWHVPVAIGNDCNVAALAEAKQGAGRGYGRVLFVTVGTGVGAGLVVDGAIDGEHRPAVAELGHLRPGLQARSSRDTVEAVASGLGIERATVLALQNPQRWNETTESADQLRRALAQGPITAQAVAQAAVGGQSLAQQLLNHATESLGWAVAQATTLMAPEIIVIGGGVSLIGRPFFDAIMRAWADYVFPPLRDSCEIVPAELGEDVVLYGGIELARRVLDS